MTRVAQIAGFERMHPGSCDAIIDRLLAFLNAFGVCLKKCRQLR